MFVYPVQSNPLNGILPNRMRHFRADTPSAKNGSSRTQVTASALSKV